MKSSHAQHDSRTPSGNRAFVAALLVATPVLLGVGYSVAGAFGLTGLGSAGFSLEATARVFSERTVWRSLAWTLWIATASTALATIATAAVATLFRSDRIPARIARALAIAPLAVPYVVAAALGLMILGQSGLISRLLYTGGLIASPSAMPALVFDRWGIGLILTLAWKEFPFLALLSFSLLATRSAALEETARTLGANRWSTFTRVTWPVLWRGLLPAITAVFIFVAGSYEVAALLGPSDPLFLPVLTLERYDALNLARHSDAYVLTMLGLLLGAAAVGVHEWTRSHAELMEE